MHHGTILVGHSILLILIAAAVTFALRAFPFVLFGGDRQMSPMLKKIADLLPPAIIAVLIIYCLKNALFAFNADTIASLGGVLATVLIHIYKRNTLISIVAGTIVYMVLIRVI